MTYRTVGTSATISFTELSEVLHQMSHQVNFNNFLPLLIETISDREGMCLFRVFVNKKNTSQGDLSDQRYREDMIAKGVVATNGES
jgi:hypothetical protein